MGLPSISIEYFTEKYGLELIGNTRVYTVPLDKRRYGFERCRPFLLELNSFSCAENNWVVQITSLFEYLLEKYPKTNDELLKFHVPWSKSNIFCKTKFMVNCVKVKCGLFMSINFTGVHSMWFIQDLIAFFNPNIEKYKFLVRIPCMNEPEEIKTSFKLLVIENFKLYLIGIGKNKKSVSIILKNILIMNRLLIDINAGWNDFFLIDELDKYSLVKSKLFEKIRKEHRLTEEQIKIANKSLQYLYNFLKMF